MRRRRTTFNLITSVAMLAVALAVGIYFVVKQLPKSALPAVAITTLAEPATAPAQAAPAVVILGMVVTQTFTLEPGWNTIYLEMEPNNPSPMVNVGTEAEPIMVHEKSTIDALLGDVEGLQSVWSWNVPQSSVDYIVDPAEGLWDEAGWKRYIHDSVTGADGKSQGFLTNLVTLHANTGYLIELADDAPPTTLTISGRPEVRHHHWLDNSYSLAGFPIMPGISPKIEDFFAGSPIKQLMTLNAAGAWEEMAAADTLSYGKAYLAYYDNSDPAADKTFTAPLDILDPLLTGLTFLPGRGGRSSEVRIANLTAVAADVSLTMQNGANVALRVTDPAGDAQTALSDEAATINLDANRAKALTFSVRSTEQAAKGEGILEIASTALGTRWLVPVTAQSGSSAGLWIGDVTVNDVSESRLGATNVAAGNLTIALRSLNESGISGAVTMAEQIAGTDASVALAVSLRLPALKVVETTVMTGTPPYVAGYLFVDENQNGQRDGDEPGLPNNAITVGGATAQTGENGSYLFAGLAAGNQAVSAAIPAGYTASFPVTLPDGTTVANTLPNRVTLDDAHISAVRPTGYLTQILPAGRQTLPYLDLTDNRVEPSINFGVVAEHSAALWTTGSGGCGQLLSAKRANLGQVINGALSISVDRASLNPPPGAVDDQLLGAGVNYAVVISDTAGQNVACGEIKVGSPTRLADGRGSEFSFRVILRVATDGTTELLPYYETRPQEEGQGTRVSSANFSLLDSAPAIGNYGDADPQLAFTLVVDPDDPRNPFKHKYHPDHDNLDRAFLPIDFDTVDPNFWESYAVRRSLRFSLVEQLGDIPAFSNRPAAELSKFENEVDWGGATRGGLYQEVMAGVHKNDITIQGHFIVRHVLQANELEVQNYDQ